MDTLGGQVGRTFGPHTVPVSGERVGAFVAATGEDPQRWTDHAPPLFANVGLFAAAPAFLTDPVVAPFTRSLIHSDQEFTWHRPLAVGEALEVVGTVAGVRARGPLNLVTFTVTAGSDQGPWLDGTSVFLMAETAATGTEADEPEPDVNERPPGDLAEALPPLAAGARVSFACGASRADLVRYAAASGDFNPIHWDHAAARGAGLPGVVVHGLLMASWMATAVIRHTSGPHPLAEMTVRFRRPLRPATAARVVGEVGADGVEVALVSGDERLVAGRIRVTP